MTNIDTLEHRMNSEDRWTSNVNYFQLLLVNRMTTLKPTLLNDEINSHLKKFEHVNIDPRIDWEREQEISELTFKEFGYYRLSNSMAYNSKLMTFDKAILYLNEFIESFGMNRKYFTNYDDLYEIIKNYGTIKNYQSAENYGYGFTDVSENTFNCALIIVDDKQIGAIIMWEED